MAAPEDLRPSPASEAGPPGPPGPPADGESRRRAPTPEEYADRVYGMFYGAALGSAFALICDRRNGDVLRDNYPQGPVFPRSGGGAEVHGYPPNDWAGDVDQMFLAARALCERPVPTALQRKFAAQVLHWISHGFPELGDREGHGVDSTTARVAAHQDFREDPARAAMETLVVRTSGVTITRAAPAATLPAPGAAEAAAAALTLASHPDSRHLAPTVFHTLLLHSLLRGCPPEPELARGPASRALAYLTEPAQRSEFLRRLCGSRELSAEAGAGDADICGVWAFRRLLRTPPSERGPELFRACVTEVALLGGRASSNASVAGAVLGAALGCSNLPGDWLAGLPGADWVEAEAAALLASEAGPA